MSIVQLHDGAGANAKADLAGAASVIDIFTIDGDYGAQTGADLIKSFENGTDLIDLGTGDDDLTIYIKEEGGHTVAYSSEAARDTGGGVSDVMFVLENVTGLSDANFDDDDFIGTGAITVDIA